MPENDSSVKRSVAANLEKLSSDNNINVIAAVSGNLHTPVSGLEETIKNM